LHRDRRPPVAGGDALPRRGRAAAWLAATALLAVAATAHAASFDLDAVAERARQIAAEAWREPKAAVPGWLREISYDQWRDIRFKPEHALWRDRKSPFQVQFFHPGLFYNRSVKLNVVEGEKVKPVQFSPSQFDYGKNDFASKVPHDLGYAGFRVHAPFKTKDYYDEVIVFLGASYFRAVGRDQVFGVSARGLAVDTAESWGEEFPYFTEFWLVAPAPTAKELTVYALLDSPSVAGAYQFVIDPGDATKVDVELRLFPRKDIRKLGVAPLTSMFFHGENTVRHFDDFRPEVHDSDGLLFNFRTGEWLWRPIENPRTLSVAGFQMEHPKGFGLLQRDRNFDHYQDLETRPDLRPSVWIVPHEEWGPGRVELVEIPNNSDGNDNVVTYWVPKRAPKPGEPLRYLYTMWWYPDDPGRPPGGRVLSTRRDGGTEKEPAHRVVIDFVGKNLAAIPADRVLRGVVTVIGGEQAGALLEQHVVKNPVTQGFRLTFRVRLNRREPLELRAYLAEGTEVLTETWSYAILP
jgi:glucans biosynthesis protein